MFFDLTEPDIDNSQFVREDCLASAYSERKEELPPNAPQPNRIGFTMRALVYSDHAGELTTRQSQIGFIIFLNSDLIYWFLKRHTSVETISFGSEFKEMKQCCEYIRGMRYNIHMMGITIELRTYILGDNQYVIYNTSNPHSSLKNKSSSIEFHLFSKGTAKYD